MRASAVRRAKVPRKSVGNLSGKTVKGREMKVVGGG